MADSIIMQKKNTENKKYLGFSLIFVGLIIFIISRFLFDYNFIITLIGAIIAILGLSLLKK